MEGHTYNPRNPQFRGMRKSQSLFAKLNRAAIPLAACFAVTGITYTMYWNSKKGSLACVDCKRQAEIADEVYFGKKRNRGTSFPS
jgi:hypothetical protein